MELEVYYAYHLTINAEESEVYIHNDEFGCGGYLVECYHKSEADKVIAELKAQKSQAEDDCVFWKKKYNDCKRELDLLKDTNAFYNGGR